ncbi:hypothetical protein AT15_01275 [Kosmotoga arenicorallina S304]|uniref:Uncharacterized protein n=1 Tax=Kosmotoga arenicorallina S304 TaxID=1453497 RepID=A0A176K058_9BACT|nr:DUF6512 family protein [Kosmotoga arenicorallina]OAA29937.1 hypothetical protein AT15_01275 [Kosmotoga arenicorallina S304]
MKSAFRTWEISGIFFIFLLGSLFHFTFEWFGENSIAGAFFPVNESVWEHLKLVYYPGLLLLIMEFLFLPDIRTKGFFLGKSLALYAMCAVILGGFYFYTLFFEDSLVADISLNFAAVVIGQLISYNVTVKARASKSINFLSIIAIIALGAYFVYATYFPPHIEMFRDSQTGSYGI